MITFEEHNGRPKACNHALPQGVSSCPTVSQLQSEDKHTNEGTSHPQTACTLKSFGTANTPHPCLCNIDMMLSGYMLILCV